MKKMKRSTERMIQYLVYMQVLIVLAFLMACNQSDTSESASELFVQLNHGDCKEFGADDQAASAGPSNHQDCLEIQANGNVLQLRHLNAGFNCCPAQINAEVTLEGPILTISESESEQGCHCLCLYDLDYTIQGLGPGIYTVRVVEPYLEPGDSVLECQFDMDGSSSTSCCVDRHHYPWE
ncbi:hypothetical protein JXQ70_00520 [bacterium]|nr:hypothetical protein [bacterium]